jgi:hypothetical protein
MSDLEITQKCAEAMGDAMAQSGDLRTALYRFNCWEYDPLHNDAQAMALVKKFKLELTCGLHDVWIASNRGTYDYESGNNADLNRAICECVAKMVKP